MGIAGRCPGAPGPCRGALGPGSPGLERPVLHGGDLRGRRASRPSALGRGRHALDSEGDLPFRPLLGGASLTLPPLQPGTYLATCVETHNGHALADLTLSTAGSSLSFELPPFRHDLAIAVRPADPPDGA